MTCMMGVCDNQSLDGFLQTVDCRTRFQSRDASRQRGRRSRFCNVWGQHMAPRMKSSWILVGVAALAVVMASGSEAYAKGGIVASMGMTQQTGDPMYNYVFQIDLLAGSTLQTGGFITVYDIPYVPDPLTSQPNLSWAAETLLVGKTPTGTPITDPDNPSIYNVTWEWKDAPITNSSSSNQDLGNFVFGTTTELSSPPSVTLLFVGSLDGVNFSNQGYVGINAIPEPSSVILLLAGVGTLPVFWLRERRRRPGRQAG